MSAVPPHCVVDASVAIKLLIEESLSNKAIHLFETHQADLSAHFAVPDLFYIECANILWKHVTRHGLPKQQALKRMTHLIALGLRRIDLEGLAVSALEMAASYSISAYDASYLAAAVRERIPLVTADERLVRRLSKGPHQVLWLGDLK